MNQWYMGELKNAAKIIDNNRNPRGAILHNVKYKIKQFFRFVLYCITLCKYSFGKWEADRIKDRNKNIPTRTERIALRHINQPVQSQKQLLHLRDMYDSVLI